MNTSKDLKNIFDAMIEKCPDKKGCPFHYSDFPTHCHEDNGLTCGLHQKHCQDCHYDCRCLEHEG
jgi:hypothetical protein